MSAEKPDWLVMPAHPRGHEILDNMRQHISEEQGVPLLKRLELAGKRVLSR